MKPFKINRNSWHYKLNENFCNVNNMRSYWEPKHNNFCAYWRATMFRMLFAGLLSIFVISLLFGMGVGIYNNPMDALIIAGIVLALFSGIVGVALTVMFFDNRKKSKAAKPDSLFMQKYKAHKSKICPMVEYD